MYQQTEHLQQEGKESEDYKITSSFASMIQKQMMKNVPPLIVISSRFENIRLEIITQLPNTILPTAFGHKNCKM